jgi:hypothetical protein
MEKELKRLEEENTRLKERIQQLEEQTLSNDEIFRYGRQLLLPNIGIEPFIILQQQVLALLAL